MSEYGIYIPTEFNNAFRCDLCHFCQDGLCNHPLGAALKRYPEQPAGFNKGIICKNWQEDYPIKTPAKLRIPLSTMS